jgi:hypothetical protein
MHGASLVGKSGELVTREEMQSKLWPADTFADLEHGVAAIFTRKSRSRPHREFGAGRVAANFPFESAGRA